MKLIFAQAPTLLFVVTLLLQGCAAKNPEWLTAPTGAYCASGLDDPCLKALAEKAYTDVTAKQVVAQSAANARSVEAGTKPTEEQPVKSPEAPQAPDAPQAAEMEPHQVEALERGPTVPDAERHQLSAEAGKGGSTVDEKVQTVEPGTLKPDTSLPVSEASAVPTPLTLPDGPIPKLAFGVAAIGANPTDAAGYQPTEKVVESKLAGAILNVGEGPVSNSQIEDAGKIADEELRAETLSGLLSLHARSMSEDQVNKVLNELYALDKDQYANALIVKLPGLLRAGDLERAKALRTVLLSAKASGDRPFSMLAFVASCYAMAGMKQDAGAIVQDSLQDGAELSADDLTLISLAIRISNGSYPMMQEFYDFKSDESRLSAYLNIAVIARQLDAPEIAHRAVADAVKFIQKSAVKVDRVKALSQILAVSPGVI